MQREIKFRAWDKTNEEFIPEVFYMDYQGQISEVDTGKELVDVRPELEFILEQYIGLKDKTGKEIFEGDLVQAKWFNGLENIETVGEVVFTHSSFCVDDKKRENFFFYGHMTFEVIGNIHQHPELLQS